MEMDKIKSSLTTGQKGLNYFNINVLRAALLFADLSHEGYVTC